MKNVSINTLKNITKAWQTIIARNVAKPNAQAFITLPNKTKTKKSQINEAKQMCKGLVRTLLSFGLMRLLKRIIPMKIAPEIEQTRALLSMVNSYVELKSVISFLVKTNIAITDHMTAKTIISIIDNALRFLIENTKEKTKYETNPNNA